MGIGGFMSWTFLALSTFVACCFISLRPMARATSVVAETPSFNGPDPDHFLRVRRRRPSPPSSPASGSTASDPRVRPEG